MMEHAQHLLLKVVIINFAINHDSTVTVHDVSSCIGAFGCMNLITSNTMNLL